MSFDKGPLYDKSFEFAKEVILTYKDLVFETHDYILCKQFLRSGTSIGALIREAEFAQSRPDFISKLNIAL